MIRASALLTPLVLAGCVSITERVIAAPAGSDAPGEIARNYAAPASPIARSIVIPAGYETIRLSGVVPDPLNPGSAAAAQFGDTEQQTASVLAKIGSALNELGLSEADVVAMTVYLVAPQPDGMMDFRGMMRAYSQRYGTEAQPNRPVRSTVQVAGLVVRGMLVEIEVTAARRPAR